MTQLPSITQAEVDRELCARSLSEFIRQAWHVIEPSRPFIEGWHIHAISEHLEAVTAGHIKRLLINIPPGTMKSLSVGVFWPAWEWGPYGIPHMRYLGTSHRERLAGRDNMRARRLIGSEWFQSLWPIALMGDQNAKFKFENEKTGFREAMAITSMTGSRGDRVIVDDPHSVDGSDSEAKRESACQTFFEGVTNRLNDADESAIVVVMQRLHEADLSGQILARELDYEHLCLPMEFEVDRRCATSIGFVDPRTEEGELLFPDRFSRESVEQDKTTMGQYAAAGQLQQRPAPREGGLFKVDGFEIVDAADVERESVVRYWDKAGTQGDGAYTVGVKMARLKDGSFLIDDVFRKQLSAARREAAIKNTAEHDGEAVTIYMEQEPGSSGKDVAQWSIKNLAGFTAKADRVSGQGSKEVRAEPYAAQVEAGNVKLLRGDWNHAFIKEHRHFPNGKYKDQVDAASGAFGKLIKGRKKPKLSVAGERTDKLSVSYG